MTESEFKQLAAEGYNRIPLVLETFADLDTPLSVYLKLANQPYTYLLESVVGGERFGRYSFIGIAAESRLEVRGNECSEFERGKLKNRKRVDDPLAFIQEYQGRFKAATQPGLPRFCGGLVGYFGYDTIRYIEKKLRTSAKPDPLGVPDILLVLSEQLAVVDNLSGKIFLVVYVDPATAGAYQRGRQRLRELLEALRRPVTIPAAPSAAPQQARSEFGEAPYLKVVEHAKRYIFDGDIMQVVLSQRLTIPFAADPLDLYRALRTLNP